MFGKKKISIDGDLYNQLVDTAEKAGYASVDELIKHVLQDAVSRQGDDSADRQQAEQQLRGLGYIE